jgi:UDP-3-O-[3-hydroxymyristoyl] glucosamine N-acyltransferase
VSDHVSVASKVRVAAKSGVVSNIEEPGDYAGFPAVCFSLFLPLPLIEASHTSSFSQSPPH